VSWASHQSSLVRKILEIAFILLVCSGLLLAQVPSSSSEILTNDSVVKMVKAGLSAGVIVEMIQNNPGNYSLNSSSLIKLKQQGVPDKVISAMLAKASSDGSDADKKKQQSSAQATPSGQRAPAGWRVEDVTNRMTDKTSFQAVLEEPVSTNPPGRININAACNSEGVTFDMLFLIPGEDQNPPKNPGFKQNTYGQTYVPGGLIGAMVMAGRHSKPWVETRVRIDDHDPKTVSSEKDYDNEAVILFSAKSWNSAVSDMDSPSHATNSDERVNEGLNQLGRMALAGMAAGTARDLFHAHKVLIEFTLANGTTSIMEIHPQDAGFREFASRCGVAAHPGANPASTRTRDDYNFSAVKAANQKSPATFTGGADEFAAQLPGLLQRTASAAGFDPHVYDKETALLTDLVRKCSSLAPLIASRRSRPKGTPLWEPGEEEQYRACSGVKNVSGAVHDMAVRDMLVDANGVQVFNGNSTARFHITLWFEALDDDPDFALDISRQFMYSETAHRTWDSPEGEKYFAIYGILDATILVSVPASDSGVGNNLALTPPNSPPSTAMTPEPGTSVKLTPLTPFAERAATIVAPARGLQNYNVVPIDTTDFAHGGVLVIDIQISPDSATDGSFDLFPADVSIPTRGLPLGTLKGKYDVPRGSSTQIKYRFKSGQVFAFGLEGNWFSPAGATGTVRFRATVADGRP